MGEIKIIWDGWNHVIPENDLIEHRNDITTSQGFDTYPCECNPKIDRENKLVIHSAMDRREMFEN